MFSALSIILLAFAVLLCAGGAAFPFWFAAGVLACGWQFIHTVATGFTSPQEPLVISEEVELESDLADQANA